MLKGRAKFCSSPVVLQAYVPKAFAVRAVLVGDKVFATKIDSRASPLAQSDWRVHDDKHVKWERMRLPKHVQEAPLRFAKRVDLLQASFDLICAPSGDWYFLEANRPGLTHWLKAYVGLDVGKELALYARRYIRSQKRRAKTR